VSTEVLEPLIGRRDATVLVQRSSGLVFRGSDEDGISYLCAHCKEAVLAEQVAEGELWDIGFQCLACGRRSVTRWPEGEKAVPQRHLLFEARDYNIGRTVYGRDVALVSAAFAQRSAARAKHAAVSETSTKVDPEFCRRLVERAEAVLGSVFESIKESHTRAKGSGTSPREPHRLMDLVDRVEVSASSLEDGTNVVDGEALAELLAVVEVFEHWNGHARWPEIRQSLANPPGFPHAVVTLSAARLLGDAGNAVVLEPGDNNGGRAADLRIELTPRERIPTEVKAPLALQGPLIERLEAEKARRLVAKARKKAGTGATGQIGQGKSAVLIVGGFHLTQEDLGTLREASEDVLAKEKRPTLMAIALVSVGALVEAAGTGSSLSATLSLEIAQNPHYAGPHIVDTSERPGLRRVGPLDEV